MAYRIVLAFFVLLAAALAQAQAQAKEPPPDAALQALFEREFKRDLREFPEYATFVGEPGLNDRLTDLSLPAIARRKVHTQALIAELQRFEPQRLNTQDRISREMMLTDLRLTADFDALYGPLPFSGNSGWRFIGPTNGPHSEFAALAKATPMRNTRDADDYLKRLAALPEHLEQVTALLRVGMQSGWMPPRATMDRVVGEFEGFARGDVDASPLFVPLKALPLDMPAPEKQRLQADARKLLAERVQPAYAKLQRFLEAEYIPACPQALAASALPAGMAYYALAVREGTTTMLTPQAIRDIGLAEVARIAAEMERVIAQTGFKGTRSEYFEKNRSDPQFYYSRGEDMLRDYRDIAKRVDAELPKLFAALPRLPYGIRAMEAYEGDNAEHYTEGALDGSRAGYFEANVQNLAKRPKYDMENTFLHEAVPGHHLQIARAQEIEGLPRFRRSGFYVAFGEGWALYAESLGPQLGLYTDPSSRFAALAAEMLRACRLVVDTGLHAFGWTREQAIAYLRDNAGLEEGFAVSEVDRYIAEPGQALGYKIGELKIRELRTRAQDALGDRFDIRHFHNAVLDDGALPLSVLEARMTAWIDGQVAANASGTAPPRKP
jgi:uncharacterized protein (DUF885 family)